jgi:hypothetical protein
MHWNRAVRAARTPRQVVMTRLEFEAFLWQRNGPMSAAFVRFPFDIVPCDCGDVNCHGWRLVERPRLTEVS